MIPGDGIGVVDTRPTKDEYSHIAVSPLTGTIGAEVVGVNAAAPLTDQVAAELHRALTRHLVLFFRDQPLTDDQHIQFARVFGEPNVYPATRAR